MSPRKVLAVALKELRQVRRDPLSLVMLLGVPAFMLLLYGYALNFDVRHVALAVIDRSQTAASRDLVAAFVNSEYFELAAGLAPDDDLHQVFARRRARLILVIPESYAGDLAARRPAEVQALIDGSDARTASTVLGYAAGIAEAEGARLSAAAAGLVTAPSRAARTPIDYRPRVWYNPELKSTQFLVPGLIGFILMLTGVLSTALSIVREKERGTMEQLRVTALRPAELLVGKTLPYLGISLSATVVILAVARVLFAVHVRGAYLDLFAVVLLYLIGALGFGLLVSSLVRSQAMAFQLGLVTSMMPAIFLSGFIFPIRSMPLPVQAVSYAVPARYFLVVLRGIVLKGAPLEPYLRDLGFLALYATVVWAIAWVRLTRREV